MVDERELRADVLEQQDLRHAIEDVRPRRQPGIRRVLGQDPLAEAVEVGDGHPGACRDADHLVQASLELLRGLDVVGQDQEVLGEERVQVVRVRGGALGLEQPADALHDDLGLARAGTGDDHDRPVAPLDDPALVGGQDGPSPPTPRPPRSKTGGGGSAVGGGPWSTIPSLTAKVLHIYRRCGSHQIDETSRGDQADAHARPVGPTGPPGRVAPEMAPA